MSDTDPDVDDEPQHRRTPGKGVSPEARPIEASVPEEFGLVQLFWGDGKGKTTAAMGMGFRAAGHGFRVHMLQFMKGGADSVDDVRGEYNAIAAMPGFSYENTGHYGWHALPDGSDETDHQNDAQAGLERAKELIAAAADADLTEPFDLEDPPEDGVHMLILDELLYAADRELIDPDTVQELVDTKPENLELVITGSHTKPDYLYDHVDLVTQIGKEKHPIDAGQRARRGTEY
ncbi:cob(I)alamin adenosyltransferase [Halohasta litchfieldiae]|uniref:Cob(I)yrinic acid a,c-diamide adenosyltransferase n=1 Tax=Halohasta litchfieldiae TaxID=1073996 RepID=A0A1H6RZZ1_9EURY|nr:cob(I)yrinic acid a,c-diamide adenosyltransferase [Halohasta litchfieldiae]ATW87959.1 cob(I)alamin adenosyltransferase [Halohasta litchfieldiae]SEI61508.1 cob(I)yrinic acid a,c-diamide adenosyltransferase [Halohasta litchfieldiae]